MDKSIIPDIFAATGLFLFTGAEVGLDTTIFEIISKFGVVAVLWFWLREMKTQMQDQSKRFLDETQNLRKEHKETLHEFKDVHKDHNESLQEQLKAKDEIIKTLQNKDK
jgi:hypothetical protein